MACVLRNEIEFAKTEEETATDPRAAEYGSDSAAEPSVVDAPLWARNSGAICGHAVTRFWRIYNSGKAIRS